MTRARTALAALAAVAAAVSVGGCGQASNKSVVAHGSSPVASAAASKHGKTVFARDARLHPGAQDVTLLSLPDMGRLLVSCDKQGRSSTTFTAAARTATADVVVQTKDAVVSTEVDPSQRYTPHVPDVALGVQQWSVAQFSEAHATITTLTVSMRPVAGSGHACAVSAMAFVVQQPAGTLTR